MKQEKPVFAAYNAWPERVYGVCLACLLWVCAALLARTSVWLAVCAAAAGCFSMRGVFFPRIIVYARGIQIAGYPFFKWESLSRARFTRVIGSSPLVPSEELEILLRSGVEFQVSWERKLLLRKEYARQILLPFWSLPAAARARLLEELARHIPVTSPAPHARLWLRTVFFTAMDLVFAAFALGGWLLLRI